MKKFKEIILYGPEWAPSVVPENRITNMAVFINVGYFFII
jgi:hypothetical protein